MRSDVGYVGNQTLQVLPFTEFVWTKMREFKRVVAELQTNAHLLYKYSE
jgi:hypothetical protein